MKKLSLFGGIILALAATACTVDSTPEQAVGTALTALQKNNLSQFKGTLSGTALEQYATQEGMTILENALNGRKPVLTDSHDVTSEGPIDFYSLVVVNQDTREQLMSLIVKCVEKSVPPTPCSGKVEVACGISTEDIHCSIDTILIAK